MKNFLALSLVAPVFAASDVAMVNNDQDGARMSSQYESRFNGYVTSGEPDRSFKLKAKIGDETVEVLAVVKVDEDRFTTWDVQRKLIHTFDDKLATYFGFTTDNKAVRRSSVGRQVTFAPGKLNRYAIVRFSNPQSCTAVGRFYESSPMPFGLGGNQKERLVRIVCERTEKTGTVLVLQEQNKIETVSLPVPTSKDVTKSSARVAIVAIKTLEKDQQKEDVEEDNVFSAMPGEHKFGTTAFYIRVPADWKKGQLTVKLVDAAGKELSQIDDSGQLQPDSNEMFSLNPFATRVISQRIDTSDSDANSVLQVPTTNLKNAAKITVTYRPRMLFAVTDIPLFPK
jgi:hypothetical protein